MIKFNLRAGVLCAAVLGVASTVQAASIVYDPFNYSSGTHLTGSSPDGSHTWGATGNGGTDDAVAAANNLAVPSPLSTTSGSNSIVYGGKGFTSYLPIGSNTSGTLYYSFAMKISDLGSVSTTSVQNIGGFTNVNNSTNSGGTKAVTVIGADVVAQNIDGTKYHLGMGTTSGATGRQLTTGSYNVGDTLFIVGEFNFSTGPTAATSELYVFNPSTDTIPDAQSSATPAASGGTVSTNTTGATGTLAAFIYYQASGASSNIFGESGITVDELRVGTSWTDVTGTPEPGSLSLLGLGALGLLRRRR